MKNKIILFTAPHKAELVESELGEPNENEVLTETEYTLVSGGTERAVLLAMNNTACAFPAALGYCGVGRVLKTGSAVTSVKEGDRVLVYHGWHSKYNLRPESDITKIEDPGINALDAVFVIIASMGLGGVRKLELELGESAMVMGQGLLGIFATQFCALSGANPVIAADLNPARRELALAVGADYAFDPAAPDFVEKVMEVTKGKGVRGTVEVTGISAAMDQALHCASPMGRISLLGCTRVSDHAIDYYSQVHKPGVRLIGAHNFVRPKFESYPHHWTHHDDCRAILDLISAGKLLTRPILSRVVEPENAPAIYDQLCDDPEFSMGTVFDWHFV